MTHEVVFRPAAESDLFELYNYIAEDSGNRRAAGFIGRIEAACRSLHMFPHRGTARDDLLPGLRIVSFERKANLAFRVDGDGVVTILRIFYGGRDYERAFDIEPE